MATARITTITMEPLPLARATVEDYCRAMQRMRHNEFWWYLHGMVLGRNFWKPFQDPDGRWWWYVKPGFAWPVDYFSPVVGRRKVRPRRRLLGWQYPVGKEHANSRVHFNVIHDLSGYDLSRISRKKKRYGIRKALHRLHISAADPADAQLAAEACGVWNSHVARTGWNQPLTPPGFEAGWAELATCPGTTVLTAQDPSREGILCAWLIARALDDTVYIDTLASHTDRLSLSPNDGLIFLCLLSAARMGVRRAHYALKSNVATLEAFKRSLGFAPHAFPSRLELRRPVGFVLRRFRPRIYKRLLGDESWSERGKP